eukprot:4697520-Amphidinium_carterae.1
MGFRQVALLLGCFGAHRPLTNTQNAALYILSPKRLPTFGLRTLENPNGGMILSAQFKGAGL